MPSISPTTDPTLQPSVSPTLPPSIAPTQPPTRAPTPECPNLEVTVTDLVPWRVNFNGHYVFIHTKTFNGRPVFEVPQDPTDRNIQYSGGQWVIDGIGDGTLSYDSTLPYPPHGASSFKGWTHNQGNYSGNYTVLIRCVLTFAPITSPTSAPTAPPTNTPTYSPSEAPSISPTLAPSHTPSYSPTKAPTIPPTCSFSVVDIESLDGLKYVVDIVLFNGSIISILITSKLL